MAIGDVFTASVESLAPGGNGILRPEGRTVFMPFTAPGDLVSGRIAAEHGTWAEAELTEIFRPSPLRTKPACPLFGRCGGCSLQHIAYEAQLAAKRAMLAETLVRIGGFPAGEMERLFPPENTVPSAPWEYRNRVSFHVLPPQIGFRARKSACAVPVDDCPVIDPMIRRMLRETAGLGGGLRVPPGRDRFTVYAKDGVFLSEAGPERGQIGLGGKTITMDASLFFQSNAAMLEKLLPVLRNAAEEGDRRLPMADLYAGTGTFTVFLADLYTAGVDLVEQNAGALDIAPLNLAGADCGVPPGRFRFFAERDAEWAGKRRFRNSGYGFAVADPPRRGVSRLVVRWLAEKGPPAFAYVSCEPSTLARDVRAMHETYEARGFWLFDFYPQTAHIEALAVFRRRKTV